MHEPHTPQTPHDAQDTTPRSLVVRLDGGKSASETLYPGETHEAALRRLAQKVSRSTLAGRRVERVEEITYDPAARGGHRHRDLPGLLEAARSLIEGPRPMPEEAP